MLALTNAAILPIDGPNIDCGTVLIADGKIAAVGKDIAVPPGYRIIDARGKHITPGLVDAHTHLGVYAESLAWSGEDVNENSRPITPELDVIDAINPDDVGLAETLAGGVTTAMVAPGSANPIGGQCAIIKTRKQSTVEAMLVKRHAGLKIAFGENPRREYGDKKNAPVTRMATAALIREAFYKAKDYLEKADKPDRQYDMGLEAIGRVLKGEMPLRAHAHRADDIVTALRLAKEFAVDIIIEHATEGHLIAETLAEHKAKLVLGPLMITRVKMELKERTPAGPAILAAHGLSFALMSDHPVMSSGYLAIYAGLAARYGLPEETALRAITLDAASILGLADRLGSVTVGKDADLVVWSGPPLLLASKPEIVIVDGEIQNIL